MQRIQKIAPCLWFDDQAEEAAEFYTAIFKRSRIVRIARYGEAGQEVHKKPPGTVMTVEFGASLSRTLQVKRSLSRTTMKSR